MESYRDAIRSVDRFLQKVVADTPDDTSLVFHSDHGEAFNEHGTYGNQEMLYEENIYVPMVVYNGTHSGRIDSPVSLRQLPQQVVNLADRSYHPEKYTEKWCARRRSLPTSVPHGRRHTRHAVATLTSR